MRDDERMNSFRAPHNTPMEEYENMRAIGFALLIFAILALGWDMTRLMMGGGIAKFAGLMDIWRGLDKTSFLLVQSLIMSKSMTLWDSVLRPLLAFPAALLMGVPGLFIIFKTRPEIQVRAPSRLEIELMRAGVDGREIRRLKKARRAA